jgi:diguanylate cyclase (GGDEF)-like protein
MTQRWVRLAGVLAIPGGVLFAAAWVVPELASSSRSQVVLVSYLPYVILVLGLGLSWRFNDARVFFALMVLLLAYWGLREGLPHGLGHGVRQRAIYNAIGLLLPLCFAGVCLLKGRGIFTVHGLVRFGVILLPAVVIAVLITWPSVDPRQLLPAAIMHSGGTAWTPASPLAIGGFALGFVLLLARMSYRQRLVDGAIVGALAAAAIAVHTGAQMISTIVFMGAGGLLLLVGVVQDGYRKAYMDELTRLPGRRALEEELLKLSGSYSVAMVDVDRFKKFNDTHGHAIGDQVLRMVATYLRHITGGGRAFRYGGEEFTILFSGKTAREAEPHLGELRERIAESLFVIRRGHRAKLTRPGISRSSRGRQRITVSIGVAERNARVTTPEKVIKAADRALYRAKQAGRNRVCR